MIAEQHLYDALRVAPAVTAIVGQRIYPDQSPEDVPIPALVYARVGTAATQYLLDGRMIAERPILEVHCFHQSRESAEALGTVVLEALQSHDYQMRNRTSDRIDASGSDEGIEISILTFERWHAA